MKRKALFLSLLSIAIYQRSAAQASFSARDFVDINNINAAVMVHGDMFWDPALQVPNCEFPKGSGKHANFVTTVWMSGYDGGNQLHIAAQTYRQDGNDYWPGPLDTHDTLTYATSHDWAKIWKVRRDTIQHFRSLGTHTATTTPDEILTWPGKGNVYARGNAGTLLTVAKDMAPFVDLNHNGIYEPLLGEYPDVKGDLALWWVFSDNGPAHTQSNGKPLGVETHVMAYAYKRNTLIDNVVYFEYTLKNKSANNYHNFRFSLFDDVDLGYFMDDYIGFDSAWRMGIAYNGTTDDGASSGHPANSYGTHPPHSALTMIVLPGDVGASYVPAGNFSYFNNDFSVIGNPTADTQYNNYMRSKIRNGVHLTNDFAGPGVPSTGLGAGPLTSYVFTGDPGTTASWSECSSVNPTGDRKFILSSNDFILDSGSQEKIVCAFIVADSAGGCSATSFSKIRTVADTAWHNYFNPPISVKVNDVPSKQLTVYPNPATDKLYIDGIADADVSIYNVVGQKMSVTVSANGGKQVADIHNLPEGAYIVQYVGSDKRGSVMFVKK